ncbi:unnamed protein product, partial [Ascophyllum nodosum]
QVRWTYQRGSHRRKVTQDFSSTFFLRCKRPVASPTAHNGSVTPSAQSRRTAPIRWILRPATPPQPDSAVATNLPAAEGTPNGPPSQTRIVTPARTPDGLDETDGKDDLRLQRP